MPPLCSSTTDTGLNVRVCDLQAGHAGRHTSVTGWTWGDPDTRPAHTNPARSLVGGAVLAALRDLDRARRTTPDGQARLEGGLDVSAAILVATGYAPTRDTALALLRAAIDGGAL